MAGERAADDRTLSRAAFLGGLLVFVALIALSVVGLGHARTIRGAANPQFWIVTLLVGAAFAAVTVALARTPARSRIGETARRIGIGAAAIWLCVFLWETSAIGSGAFKGPIERAWTSYKG